jgi:hypothetical protein
MNRWHDQHKFASYLNYRALWVIEKFRKGTEGTMGKSACKGTKVSMGKRASKGTEGTEGTKGYQGH